VPKVDPSKPSPKMQIITSIIGVLCVSALSFGANTYFIPRETHTLETKRLEKMITGLETRVENRQLSSDKNITLQLVDFRLDYLRIKIDYLAKLKMDQGITFPSSYNLDLEASMKEYNDRLTEKQKLVQNP